MRERERASNALVDLAAGSVAVPNDHLDVRGMAKRRSGLSGSG